MATRTRSRALAFAPAVFAAAVVLWLGARVWLAGDHELGPGRADTAAEVPAGAAQPSRGAGKAEQGVAAGTVASVAAHPPPGDSAPEAPAWDEAFRDSADYFQFVQAAAPAAIAGNGRAQYLLGHALAECSEQVRVIDSMQKGGVAANFQAYLALVPDARTRQWVAERVGRCEKFFAGSPFEGLALPPDAHDARYWLDRARASRDPLAVMDRAIEESLHQHFDSMPPEHRAELLDDVRTAVASREPAALYKIGTVYSQSSVARDAVQGTAWLVAACEAGFDCSNANPLVGQGCAAAGICDPEVTLQQSLQRNLASGQLAEVYAASRDILERIDRGDWDGLQPYLETK